MLTTRPLAREMTGDGAGDVRVDGAGDAEGGGGDVLCRLHEAEVSRIGDPEEAFVASLFDHGLGGCLGAVLIFRGAVASRGKGEAASCEKEEACGEQCSRNAPRTKGFPCHGDLEGRVLEVKSV